MNNKKMSSNKKTKIIVLGSLILVVSLFSGCRKKMECSIAYAHAHKYVSTNGLSVFKISEYEKEPGGYAWTDETIRLMRESEKKKIEFLNKNNLIEIDLNTIILQKITRGNINHTEYEYSYLYQDVDYYISPHGSIEYTSVSVKTDLDGDVTVSINIPVYKTCTGYDWTQDENHINQTGRTRDVIYKYYGYNIKEVNVGEYSLVRSDSYDSVLELEQACEYLNPNDFCYAEYYETYKQKVK